MIMATGPDPYLCSTNVIEDVHNHDEIIGLKLSYTYEECLFTVLITNQVSSSFQVDSSKNGRGSVINDLISRYNDACTWTADDKTTEDVDERLDPIWEEAEDLARAVAFEKIRMLGHEHKLNTSDINGGDLSPKNLGEYLSPKAFNIQLVAEEDGLNAISRPDLPLSPRFAIEPEISSTYGLMSFHPKDVKILQWFKAHVLKVQTESGIFCCKLNNAEGQGAFLREFDTLQRIRSSALSTSIRIPKLRGVVKMEGGVMGLLTDFIEAEESDLMTLLKRKRDITPSNRQIWADQISTTLKHLHSLHLIWGDAKTANVLIDKDSRAWLIDFGGGFTRGWIDEALFDTREGDLQGLKNTLLDIYDHR